MVPETFFYSFIFRHLFWFRFLETSLWVFAFLCRPVPLSSSGPLSVLQNVPPPCHSEATAEESVCCRLCHRFFACAQHDKARVLWPGPLLFLHAANGESVGTVVAVLGAHAGAIDGQE